MSFIDGVHLRNFEMGQVGTTKNVNNAYSANLPHISHSKLSTNQEPGNTNSGKKYVSTNRKARNSITTEEGGRSYPVRLPGSN